MMSNVDKLSISISIALLLPPELFVNGTLYPPLQIALLRATRSIALDEEQAVGLLNCALLLLQIRTL